MSGGVDASATRAVSCRATGPATTPPTSTVTRCAPVGTGRSSAVVPVLMSRPLWSGPCTCGTSGSRVGATVGCTDRVTTSDAIDRGLGRLPKGRRRKDLERRWATLLDAFADTIATYDVPAARATARMVVASLDQGRPMSLADAQIGGICLTHAATLATRNMKDFSSIGDLTLINPFDHPHP